MKLSSFGVRFKPSWSIARLKAEIARKRNVSPAGLKIIFAGQELPDTITLGVTEIIIAWLYVYLSSYVILMLVYSRLTINICIKCCFDNDLNTFVFKSENWFFLSY